MPYYDWKKTITFIIIGVVIGFIARGFISGTFDDGWQAAREATDSGREFLTEANIPGWYQLVGKVTAIDGDNLTVDVPLLHVLDDESLQQRQVKVDQAAHITLRRAKDLTELLSEEQRQRLLELEEAINADTLNDLDRAAAKQEITEIHYLVLALRKERILQLREELQQGGRDVDNTALERELAEWESDYLQYVVGLEEIRVGDELVLLAEDTDFLLQPKFTAYRLEIRR